MLDELQFLAVKPQRAQPVTALVHLVGDGEILRLETSDLSVSLRSMIPSPAVGDVATNLKKLTEVVALAEGEIHLTLDPLRVEDQTSCWDLQQERWYLEIESPSGDGVELRDLPARAVAYALPDEDPVTRARGLEPAAILRPGALAAASPHRAVRATFDADVPEIWIPPRALGDGCLVVGEHLAAIRQGHREIVWRKIEREFPNVERMASTEPSHWIQVDRKALAAALRRVQVASPEVRLALPDLTAVSDIAARTTVDCEPLGGELVLQGKYLADFLRASEDDVVELGVSSGLLCFRDKVARGVIAGIRK